MAKIDKADLALEYLNQAIECFLDTKRFASALHLAGAAQEIIEKLIKGDRSQGFLTIFTDVVGRDMAKNGLELDKVKFLATNRTPKNAVKHLDSKKDRYVELDLEEEAFKMLAEALMDAMIFHKNETENMTRFKEYFTANALAYLK
ncbi:hypothetical protein Q4557_18935 [Shewanella sp. 5_MG-2023]|uniref:hypothetical protein n=1 Tax=Shewanella sp. 5_MG-2023 TaxID=3062656 RepID=UPI0026E4308D|nr:hypothetical protein [Shewanella sp. 5_MG-2023]MDO6642036.1 hypothetical protein [Shewanella sp. 5_MG-2023]